jgi:ribose 5-phosphate isomerase B
MAMLVIGCDHAGVELKNYIISRRDDIYEGGMSVNVMDVGCFNDTSVDYPDIVDKLIDAYKHNKNNYEYVLGVLICGTGLGMSISANKYKGIRAALVTNRHHAKLARQHNDANILCLGARENIKEIGFLPGDEPYPVIFAWIKIFANTEFEGNRHKRRIEKIIEKEGL